MSGPLTIPFAFTFKKSFCEKPLLKSTLRHELRHFYAVKKSCGKIPNKIYLKTQEDQTPSIFQINFTKASTRLKLQETIYPLWEKNKKIKSTFTCQNQARNENQSPFFPTAFLLQLDSKKFRQFHFSRAFLYFKVFIL